LESTLGGFFKGKNFVFNDDYFINMALHRGGEACLFIAANKKENGKL